jgi:hypothetical protein
VVLLWHRAHLDTKSLDVKTFVSYSLDIKIFEAERDKIEAERREPSCGRLTPPPSRS